MSLAPPVTIIGSGPAALHAALLAGGCGLPCSLHLNASSSNATRPPRIECVPVQALGILSRAGVDPRQLGVHQILTNRRAAWDSPAPATFLSQPYVCIERPHLENTLLASVLRMSSLTVCSSQLPEGKECIDATGFLPKHEACVMQPWVARVFALPNPEHRAIPFSLASLPVGYVYCMASWSWINVAVAGPAQAWPADSRDVADLIEQSGQDWILKGLPPLFTWERAQGGCVSFGGSGLVEKKIGSAAFRRDILSSHGVIAALSDAHHAIQCVRAGVWTKLADRHRSEMRAHLQSLSALIPHNCFAGEPAWATYAAFIRYCLHHTARA
jgi:hypothetical protein